MTEESEIRGWMAGGLSPQAAAALASGAAGGEQTVRLLGPFNVAYDTPGIAVAPGVPVADLAVGQVVIVAWVELIDWWNGSNVGSATTIEVLVGGADWESVNTWPVIEVDVHENGASGVADANISPSAVPNTTDSNIRSSGVSKPQRLVTAGKLLVKVNLPGNTTTGEANVYALIAEPSA